MRQCPVPESVYIILLEDWLREQTCGLQRKEDLLTGRRECRGQLQGRRGPVFAAGESKNTAATEPGLEGAPVEQIRGGFEGVLTSIISFGFPHL